MKWKLLLGIGILFLLIGSVAAVKVDSLQTIPDYTDWDDLGYSNYTTNSNRYFFVEKVTDFDDEFKDEWFNNHTDLEYMTTPIGDNIYYFEDDSFEFYGYQEVVDVDGQKYMVSINQNSHLSPGEKNLYLQDLKDFNKLNNLEPVGIF